jgi:hypothetical protein
MSKNKLLHFTAQELASKIAIRLPFTNPLSLYHPSGIFPLLKNPNADCRAAIIGMLVLRPAWAGWTGPFDSFHDTKGWCYGLAGTSLPLFHNQLKAFLIRMNFQRTRESSQLHIYFRLPLSGIQGPSVISDGDVLDAYRFEWQLESLIKEKPSKRVHALLYLTCVGAFINLHAYNTYAQAGPPVRLL